MWQLYPDPLRSILKNPSLLDDSPTLSLLEDIMSVKEDYARRVSVGALSANDGTFRIFNQTNTDYKDFNQAALSSSSIPGVFPP